MRLVRVFTLLISVLPVVAAHATTFTVGQYVTSVSVEWGDIPSGMNPSALLENYYNTVYAPSDLMTVGGTEYMIFDSADAVIKFEHTDSFIGPGVLTVDLDDPVTCGCGFMGATAVALRLNVDFSAAGVLPTGFGGLILTDIEDVPGIDSSLGAFDGMTVSEFLAYQEGVLGGASTPYTLEDLDTLSNDLSTSFEDGELVSDFAQAHLELPATASATPEPATWMLMLAAAGLAPLARRRARNAGLGR